MRTIRPAKTVAGRKRQMARLRAEFEELNAADPPIASSSEPAPDLVALVAAEVERQRERDRQAVEAAEVARRSHPTGSGCAHCGAPYSDTGDPDPWSMLDEGLVCVECWNDHVIYDRLTDTSADRKVRVIAALLGLDGLPLLAVGNPTVFAGIKVWFTEHDAEPASERWAHLGDCKTLREQWDAVVAGPPAPDPEIVEVDEPCEECGSHDRFLRRDSSVNVACGRCETCVDLNLAAGTLLRGHRRCSNPQVVEAAGTCVDCSVCWIAGASGNVPAWWIKRRGKRLPDWARQLAGVLA
jgi:hypothetical protein